MCMRTVKGSGKVLEEKIVEAIELELKRHAASRPRTLTINTTNGFQVSGAIDLDALAMAVAGSVAGGP